MFQTAAIVLKKTPFYEVDNFIAVYSQDLGKIEVVARGSQKITSKLSAHLEPINLVSLEFINGKNFKVATSAQITEGFQNIKSDFNKTKLVLEIFDYIDKYLSFEEQDLNFWQFLLNFLNEVQKMSNFNEQKSEILKIYFLINFLKFLGFLPNLSQCSKCSETDFKKVYLVPKQGLLCQNCYQDYEKESFEINNKELMNLRKFLIVKLPEIRVEDFLYINFLKIQKIIDEFLSITVL